jgi:hypothetical protein
MHDESPLIKPLPNQISTQIGDPIPTIGILAASPRHRPCHQINGRSNQISGNQLAT